MKIILVGIGTAPHLAVSFSNALQQMGHTVRIVDERWAYTPLDRKPLRPIRDALIGSVPSGAGILRWLLLRACRAFQPQLVLATTPRSVDRATLAEIRSIAGCRLATFLSDSPFNPVVSSSAGIEALSGWDLVATPRRASLQRVQRHCEGKVLYLPFAYDPALHFREPPKTVAEVKQYSSDVAFLGGCDLDRVPYLDALASCAEINVNLYGGYYHYTPALQSRSRKPAFGRKYRLALSGTKVAPCLVRKANEDGHVMRTFEVPACNAFLLAERTEEHAELFREDHEAVFFDSPQELVDKTRFYVKNDKARQEIANRGCQLIRGGRNTYADRLAVILQQCFGS